MPADESELAPEKKRPDRWRCARDLTWPLPELMLDTAEWLDQLSCYLRRHLLGDPPIFVRPTPFGEHTWAYESFKHAQFALLLQGAIEPDVGLAYEWLQANGVPGLDDYKLPNFIIWLEQVLDGRPIREYPLCDTLWREKHLTEGLACIPGFFKDAIDKCRVAPNTEMRQALVEIRDPLLNACQQAIDAAEATSATMLFLNSVSPAADQLRRLCAGLKSSEATTDGKPDGQGQAGKTAGIGPMAEGKPKRKGRKKAPPQLLRETRERQAAEELVKNPDITSRALGKILDCDPATVVRLQAWKKRGVLHRDPPRAEIEDGPPEEDSDPHTEDSE